MNCFRIGGQFDVFLRRLVRIKPVRMGVVDPEEFEPTLATFRHQTHDLCVRNRVIPDRINRDVLGRKHPRDYVVLARQNTTAFSMRLAAGMLQEVAEYFAATSDGSFHCSRSL